MSEMPFEEDCDVEQKMESRHETEEEVFRHQVSKDGRVFLYWKGNLVNTLSEKEGCCFLEHLDQAQDGQQRQLVMAKITGNFKRGNEREGKNRGRG